jgi:hypothetical protein
VGGACGRHGRGKRSAQGFWESPKERDHSEDRGVDGRMESEWILGRLGGDWIQLAHYKGRLRAVLNTMMNIRILISVSQPLGCDSQEGREKVSSLKEKCKNACIHILIIVVGRGNVTVFL